MRRLIKKIYDLLVLIIPGKDKCIMLESVPDLSDNTKAVFDEMISRGLNKKYKIIWKVSDAKKDFPKIENVLHLDRNSWINAFLLSWYSRRAKCLVCCNAPLTSQRAGQTSFYLSHGTPIKSTREHIILPKEIDYCTAAGPEIVKLIEHEFSIPEEKIAVTGFARNDALTTANRDLKGIFSEKEFEKVIVWYPTFRQHKNGVRNVAKNALPIICDTEKATQLNAYAKEHKVLIVLKPHFAQDVSYIKDLNLSNIIFINDEFFVEKRISSYEFVGSCDALITDYSSIYYDYMLCDKPIALIWEDYEEYKSSQGFALNVEPLLDGGEKVYNLDELEIFVKNISEGIDVLKEERNIICNKVNISKDGLNAKRTVDFIVEKSGL